MPGFIYLVMFDIFVDSYSGDMATWDYGRMSLGCVLLLEWSFVDPRLISCMRGCRLSWCKFLECVWWNCRSRCKNIEVRLVYYMSGCNLSCSSLTCGPASPVHASGQPGSTANANSAAPPQPACHRFLHAQMQERTLQQLNQTHCSARLYALRTCTHPNTL